MRYRWLVILAALFILVGVLLGWMHANKPSPQVNAANTADLGMMLLESSDGVSVLAVRDGSIAEQSGIRPTDLLLQVNDTPFATVDELEALLQRYVGSPLRMQILRADESLVVQLPSDSALH